jgi:hypothetical protein
MTSATTRLSRRSFLFAAGAGGAAAAATAVVSRAPHPERARDDDDKDATRGYHASRHVQAYYRTVKM